MSENIVVNFEKVEKCYGREKVLRNLSFAIKRNDFVAFVGNNGCGKTTTLNVLSNLVSYNQGTVEVLGKKVTPNYLEYKSKLGIVLSHPHYIKEFSSKEYLEFVCQFQNVPKGEIEMRIIDMLSLFELEAYQNKPIKSLSTGNKMKVSICAALIHNPEIIVLDEPFVSLDIHTTQNLITVLSSFKGKKTLIITSHSLDLVVELCDHFYIIEEGEVKHQLNKKHFLQAADIKSEIIKMLSTNKEKNTS